MKLSAELVEETTRLLPDLGTLEELLETEPQTILSQAFPAEGTMMGTQTAIVESGFGIPAHPIIELEREAEPAIAEQLEVDLRRERERSVQAARSAIVKLRREGANADFEPEEVAALEAIILDVGRPALLIFSGSFLPPAPLPPWEILNQVRNNIESTFRSVGRIEVEGHPDMQWVGTGFLVAEDVVMTNRHVARVFSERATSGDWVFERGMQASINYGREMGETEPTGRLTKS